MDDHDVIWRVVGAAVAGRSHVEAGRACDDVAAYRVLDSTLLAAVADGAGSAARARHGAQLAVSTSLHALETRVDDGRFADADDMQAALAAAQQAIAEEAASAGAHPRDYACTLLLVVAQPRATRVLHVGDGACVASTSSSSSTDMTFRVVSWPQNGEYANTTAFITDAGVRAYMAHLDGVETFAIFFHGLQSVALDWTERTAFGPFFSPLVAALRRLAPRELEPRLAEYLAIDPRIAQEPMTT